jgi:hypothetical protein
MAKSWPEELPCVLTAEELLERGQSLALQNKLWRETDRDRDSAAKEFKGKLSKIEAEEMRLAHIVRHKEEPRPVIVTEVRDYKSNRVDVIRLDTQAVVRTRVMTEAERQLELIPRIEPAVVVVEEPFIDEEEPSAAAERKVAEA